ncbi:hypothetical protein ScPMuIL_009699 [Solemya velum]
MASETSMGRGGTNIALRNDLKSQDRWEHDWKIFQTDDPISSPSTFLPDLEVKTKQSTIVSSITSNPTHNTSKAENVPGSGFYDVGGNIVWKEAKKKNSPRSNKESPRSNKDVRSPASLGAIRSQAGRFIKIDRGSKLSLDLQSSPPSRMTNSVDLHGHMYNGYTTPLSDTRADSRFWGRGQERSFGPGRRLWFQESPGPGEYSIKDSSRGVAHTMGMKLPPPHIVQQAIKTDGPSPNEYQLTTSMGKGTAKSFLGRRKDPFQPGEYKDNPASNNYDLGSSMGRESKVSFKGNRHQSTYQGSGGYTSPRS